MIRTIIFIAFIYLSNSQSTHWKVSCEYESNYYIYESQQNPNCLLEQIDSLKDKKCDGAHQAFGTWNDTLFSIGLSTIRIHTCANVLDSVQAYAAGFLEGYITQERAWQYYYNTLLTKPKNDANGNPTNIKKNELTDESKEYLKLNDLYLKNMILKNKKDAYWHQVALSLIQLYGQFDGYNQAAPTNQKLPYDQFRLINIKASLNDIEKYQPKQNNKLKQPTNQDKTEDHCSVLVKVLDNKQDILVSHITWSTYEEMTRIWKQYEFNFHLTRTSKKLIPSTKIHMSSYPAQIHSTDDFYITNQQLAVTETTINIYNDELYQKYVQPNTVSETIRVMVANRLAKTAEQWVKIFQKENDGTYCNQWMVLDYKLFKPGKALKNGLFYVAEQIPGDFVYMDGTDILRKNGYWASYNTASFESVRQRGGEQQKQDQWGDFYSFEKTSRAQIFRRDQASVQDLEGMQKIMRNADLTDPLATCSSIGLKCVPDQNGRLLIAGRLELNPINGTYPISSVKHKDLGTLDAKITSFDYIKNMKMRAISSPPYENVQPFDWSLIADLNVSHIGLPDKWMFPWVDLSFK